MESLRREYTKKEESYKISEAISENFHHHSDLRKELNRKRLGYNNFNGNLQNVYIINSLSVVALEDIYVGEFTHPNKWTFIGEEENINELEKIIGINSGKTSEIR